MVAEVNAIAVAIVTAIATEMTIAIVMAIAVAIEMAIAALALAWARWVRGALDAAALPAPGFLV